MVLALCLLLVLWQCFRAPTDGRSLSPRAPSSLNVPAIRCATSASGSAWFDARYNPAVRPLLTGTAHELSADVVQWWLVSRGMTLWEPGALPGLPHPVCGGSGPRASWTDVKGGEQGAGTPGFPTPPHLWGVLHPFPTIPQGVSKPFPGLCWEEQGCNPLWGHWWVGVMLPVAALSLPDAAGSPRWHPAPGRNSEALYCPSSPDQWHMGPISLQDLCSCRELGEAEGVWPRAADRCS